MNYLPYDADANDHPPQKAAPDFKAVALAAAPLFPYVRKAFTPAEFVEYVARYDFGSIPPSYSVIHHTAIPDASWAPMPGQPVDRQWDYGEQGLSDAAIAEKRLRQIDGIKNYYQNSLGWNAGPHLFVDDRFVYAMTPMYDVGIHAAQGNSTIVNGRLAYSIGIEVVGCFTSTRWPEAIQANVRSVVQTLHNRLGTFQLAYKAGPGFIAGHRAYNKPSCPGDAITNDFIIQVVTAAPASVPAAPLIMAPSVTDDLYVGTSPRIRLDTFQAVLRDHNSPIPPEHSNDTYELLVRREINAARFLAHMHTESQFGKDAQAMATANPLNIKARQGDPAVNGFANFNGAWYLGCEYAILRLKSYYGQYGKLTWRQVGSEWARESADWDPLQYLTKCDATYLDILKRES